MKLLRILKSWLHWAGMLYVRYVCAREYKLQNFKNANERPVEFEFLFRQLSRTWPKSILDVGTGTTALPHLMRNCGFMVTAIDNITDYWPRGMINRHYHVINDDITHSALTGTFDMVSCISVLEHIQDHQAAIGSMSRLLVPGGRLVLTCPYNEQVYSGNVYDLPDSSVTEKFTFVTQAFSRREVNSWLENGGFDIVEQEYWQFFEGKYWTCGDRVEPPRKVEVHENHQLTCLLLEKVR